MRKFLALVSVLTSTALVAPMAMAKTESAPKARTSHSKRASNGKVKSKGGETRGRETAPGIRAKAGAQSRNN